MSSLNLASLSPTIDAERSDPSPEHPQAPETVKESDVVAEVNRLYTLAKTRRKALEIEWARNMAYLEGKQWLRIGTGNRLTSFAPLDPLYAHTLNLIRKGALTVVNLSTQNKPDAQAVPLSDLDIDEAAADEADSVLGYADSVLAGQRLRSRAAYLAIATGAGWRQYWWDSSATAELVTPEGVLPNARIGNIKAEIVPSFEVFIDPQADCYESAAWLIRETVRSVNWCRERWDKVAEGMQPDARSIESVGSYVDPYMLDYKPDEQLNDGVKVRELWEKPSPKYRQGRHIVVAGGRVMNISDISNPYHSKPNGRCLPIVPTYYQDAMGHAYGLSLLNDVIGPQDEFNRLWSKGLSRIEGAKAYVALPEDVGVSPKAVQSTKECEIITYDATLNAPPISVLAPPNMAGEIVAMCQALSDQIDNLMGSRPIAQGQAPGDMSGLAIDLLQQANNTQHDQFRANIEQAEAEAGEWLIYLFGKNAGPVPRLLGLDTMENREEVEDGKPMVRTLEALRGGGSCRVRVTPGSATARTPAAQRAFVIQLQQLGVFGPFQDPSQVRSAKAFVAALEMAGSTKILRHLDDELERLEAEQQAQAEQQMMMQEAQLQAEAAAQPDPEEQFAMMQAQKDLEARDREHAASLDVQKEAAKATLQSMTAQTAPTPRRENGR